MAFVTEKTLFIHVQKTGGMTVRKMLYRVSPTGHESGDAEGERHFGMPELLAAHPGISNGRLSFGFVRNPLSWFRSRWAFAKETGLPTHVRHSKAAAATWMAACWADDYPTFIKNMLDRYPGIATQTMFRMLGLWSDNPVNRVCTTENLTRDVLKVLKDAGEEIPAGVSASKPENKTAGHAMSEAGPLSRDLIEEIIRAEIALCAPFYPELL